MNEKRAYEVLAKNINRDLCFRWFMLMVPLIIIIIILLILAYLAPLNNYFNFAQLPTSNIKIENIIPALFTGTITGGSILLGFFSVSAYNFYQHIEKNIEKCRELRDKNDNKIILNSTSLGEHQRMPKTAKTSEVEDISNRIKNLDQEIGDSKETGKLIKLNMNALAHQQEHLCKFMVNFLVVTVGLLLSTFLFFVLTLVPTFQGILGTFAFYSLYSIFVGLILFLREFMAWTGHRELGDLVVSESE